ncbi:MAG: nicotinate phosphoribosyltransferase [bacterium]
MASSSNIKYSDKHFTQADLPVNDLDQIYMVSSLWYDSPMRESIGTFDLVVRDMPKNRNFMVFTGLEEMLLGINEWRYSDSIIRILLKEQLISPSFGKYLKSFRFKGDVWAMPEGTLFFPGETVVRITAPLIDANLFSAFLMTSLSSNTTYATKFIRSVLAGGKVSVVGPAPQRAPGFETGFKAMRSGVITGSDNHPTPIGRDKTKAGWIYPATIAYHAFIASYPSEREAMETAGKFAKFALSLMIDTYDLKQGLINAIPVCQERNKRGLRTKVVIDSGDLAKQCRYVRKELDKAGLKNVTITLSSNLDEYKIDKLVKAKVPADTFIVNTEAVTSADDPKLEAVYKLVQVDTQSGVQYTAKLSSGKKSWPGKKQVFRIIKKGKYLKDIIGLETENFKNPLLQRYMKQGKIIKKLPSVQSIRKLVFEQIKKLPPKYLRIDKTFPYKVEYSARLKSLDRQVQKHIRAQYLKQ